MPGRAISIIFAIAASFASVIRWITAISSGPFTRWALQNVIGGSNSHLGQRRANETPGFEGDHSLRRAVLLKQASDADTAFT